MKLDTIRTHLDRLDESILLLLAERMSYMTLVAEYKKANNMPRFQPEREKAILEHKRALAKKHGLNPEFVEELFKRIIAHAHTIQKETIE